jgi:hypothetical protein
VSASAPPNDSGLNSLADRRVIELLARRPAFRRAFGVLDPGGRIRTGTSALDRRVLYLLSYPGVVAHL